MNIYNTELNIMIKKNILEMFYSELAHYDYLEKTKTIYNVSRKHNIENIIDVLEKTAYLNIFAQSGANVAFNIGMMDMNASQYKKQWNKLKDFQKENRLELFLEELKKTDNTMYKHISTHIDIYCDKGANKKVIYDANNGRILEVNK